MVDQTNDSKRGNLYSKPSGNPYASLPSNDEIDVITHKEPTEAQKRAYIKNLQDPYAYIEILGDPGVAFNSAADNADEATQNDNLESEELNKDWLLKILHSYLAKSTQPRDRKAVNDMALEYITLAKVLTPKQKSFIKHRLISMEPEGERRLEAARTTSDSIKKELLKLLDEAKKQQ